MKKKRSPAAGRAKRPEYPPTESKRTSQAISRVRGWLTGWTVTILIVPVIIHLALEYRNRPRLSLGVAKALVASHRTIGADGVHEYRAVIDLQAPCVTWLVEYSAESEQFMPLSANPSLPRMVYGVYLENTGRSELTNLRLTFRSRGGEYSILGSPQLAISETQQLDPDGQTSKTITVASMAARAKGVIVAALPIPGAQLIVAPNGDKQLNADYDLSERHHYLAHQRPMSFSGSAQLADVPIISLSVDELYTRQKEAFGLAAIPLPIDPIGVSGAKGRFSMQGPFRTCPSAGCECYTVGVSHPPSSAAGGLAIETPTSP